MLNIEVYTGDILARQRSCEPRSAASPYVRGEQKRVLAFVRPHFISPFCGRCGHWIVCISSRFDIVDGRNGLDASSEQLGIELIWGCPDGRIVGSLQRLVYDEGGLEVRRAPSLLFFSLHNSRARIDIVVSLSLLLRGKKKLR